MRPTLLIFLCLFSFQPSFAEDEPDLISLMGKMQYFTHKLMLSTQADNLPLARFYGHELEEIISGVIQVESYKDYPVGQLAETSFYPRFIKLESALKRGQMEHVPGLLEQMIDSCNNCHQITEHAFIEIGKDASQRYLQVF